MAYDTDRYREEQRRNALFREADAAEVMARTDGWKSLVAWAEAQIQLELTRLERGVGDWDEYQRTTGRLQTWRAVIGRPAQLRGEANDQYDTGE